LTSWTFTFQPDGTYKRVSFGHFGHTTVTGDYYYKGDTIKIQSGYEDTGGTVNSEYLVVDDKIIDLSQRYDYLRVKENDSTAFSYASQIRDLRYPQIATKDARKIQEVTDLLQFVFNSSDFKKYIKFDKQSQERIPCTPYKFLETQLDIDGVPIEFIRSDFLDSRPFLTLIDIDVIPRDGYKRGVVEIQSVKNQESIIFFCDLIDGVWTCQEPSI
jgi:hypothetical protein